MNCRLLAPPMFFIVLVALVLLPVPSVAQRVYSTEPSPAVMAQASPPAPDAKAPTAENIKAVPASCTGSNSPYTCTILASTTWQETPLILQAGSPFSVFYTSGSWTVDYRSIPYVGPAGYTQDVDSQIPPDCKFDSPSPYARLLGQIGTGPLFSIGADLTFTANADGPLFLRINDHDGCLSDNDGALALTVQYGIMYSLITGRVTDVNGNPLPNIRIATTTGDSTTTQADGSYSFGDRAPGAHTVIPAQSGYNFSPAERSVTVPPTVNGVDFIGVPTVFSCNSVMEIPVSECEGLVALYNSTNGQNWNNRDGWLITLTPCSWFGVSCYNNHLFLLNLGNNHLVGTIPPQINKLAVLSGLYLNNNQLSGAIPPELGALGVLDLYLDHNQLSGTIPRELGNLSKVYHLYLDNNQLTGNIPVELGNLSHIISLHLSANQLNGPLPTQLGNLNTVVALGLCCNQLSGALPGTLGKLTKLKFLTLDANQLTGNLPPELGNLVELTELHLENNPWLHGPLPSSLTNLSKLVTFWFHNTALCEPDDSALQNWLAQITNLQRTNQLCVTITVQFSAASYSLGESGGAVTVHVTLSAPSSRFLAVNYATSDGTATAGSDYLAATGTVTFSPGETSKTFTVAIINDAVFEPAETIHLALSNPTNALLGTPANASVTITDDDPPPTNTPVNTATNTPLPPATNTPIPTWTYTPVPPATNTPVPTATSSTPLPATHTPMPTATPAPATVTPVPATNTPVSPGDGSWVKETIWSVAGAFKNISFALSANGELHLSAEDSFAETQLCPVDHIYWNGAKWTFDEVNKVDPAENCGGHYTTAIDTDPANAPHIIYDAGPHFSITNALRHAYWSNNRWQSEIIDPGARATDSVIVISPDNQIHVVYRGAGGLNYLLRTSTGWQPKEVIDVDGSDGALALDRSGVPHILYSAGGAIWYAQRSGNAWHKQLVKSAASRSLALALDSADNPHSAYIDPANNDIVYLYRSGSTWATETITSHGSLQYQHVYLAVDASGRPHVGYDDAISISYQRREGHWIVEFVDFGKALHGFVLDGSDKPHFVYSNNFDLMHAYKRGQGVPTPTPTATYTPAPSTPGVFITNFTLTDAALFGYPDPNALLTVNACQPKALWLQVTNNGPSAFAGGKYMLQWVVSKDGKEVEKDSLTTLIVQPLPALSANRQANVPIAALGFFHNVQNGQFAISLIPESGGSPPFPQNPAPGRITITGEIGFWSCLNEYIRQSVNKAATLAVAFGITVSEWIQKVREFFGIGSPAYPLITNRAGQRAGFLENGQIVNEIPGSQVYTLDDKRIIVYPQQDARQAQLVGYADGVMNVHIGSFQSDGGAVLVAHENVPVTQGMKATVNSTAGRYTLEIDANGDGQVDQSRPPDSIEQVLLNHAYLPLVNN